MSKSATSRKESYFVPSTPSALDGAQFIAVNRTGSLLYGLRVRIELSIVEVGEAGEPPEVLTTITEKSVCQYHVASGSHRTFALDDDWEPVQLTRLVEFYTMLDDALCVLVVWDADRFVLQQTVVHLEPTRRWAQTVAVKRITLSRVVGAPLINLSSIDTGRLLLCGARNSVDGTPERLCMSIPIDPMSRRCSGQETPEQEDLSGLIEEFNTFLRDYKSPELGEHQKLVNLFVLDLNERQMTILLAEIPRDELQDEPLFSTRRVGFIDRVARRFSVESIDNSAAIGGVDELEDPMRVSAIGTLKARNGSVWMSLQVPDSAALHTWYWRLKHLYIRILLRVMVAGFHGSMYLWRFDNGASFHFLTRVLKFLHGPTMIPVFTPHKKHFLCCLDAKNRRFHRVTHAARIVESTKDPNITEFALNFDVDSSGGALVIDFPNERNHRHQRMALTYYPNPSKPQSLARMCAYSAYRNFPSFEKSSLLRRFTGLIDWKWSV